MEPKQDFFIEHLHLRRRQYIKWSFSSRIRVARLNQDLFTSFSALNTLYLTKKVRFYVIFRFKKVILELKLTIRGAFYPENEI